MSRASDYGTPISRMTASGGTPQGSWLVPAIGWDADAGVWRPYKVTVTDLSAAMVTTVRSGTGVPSAGLGIDGDYYVRTDVTPKVIYGPKAAGAWPSGTALAGALWYTDSGAPDVGDGADGDFYLRGSNGQVYQKVSGAWVDQGFSLIGPQGIQGIQGPTGTAATITIGTVTTGAPGSSVIVTNVGTSAAAVLDFSIPEGDVGATGPAAWSAPVAWLTGTAYTAGPPASVVTQGGETYVCLTSHTSGTFSTDLAAVKWIKVAAKGSDGVGVGDVLAANNGSEWTATAATFRGNVGAAPLSPDFLVKTANGELSGERVVTDVSSAGGVVFDWATAGQAKAKLYASAGSKMLYSTAANTFAEADVSATGRSFLNSNVGTSGQIWVASASNLPAPVSMSGDATISNAGAVTVAATIAKLAVANTWTAVQGYAPATLTYNASQTWDVSANPFATLAPTGNITSFACSNVTAGRYYVLKITQDTSVRTIAYTAANFKFIGGAAPTLSTGSGAVDYIVFVGVSSTLLHEVGRAQAVA